MTFVKLGVPVPNQPGFPKLGKITKCSRAGAWYQERVGETVTLERHDSYGYWAREGGQYNPINWILPEDIEIQP